MSQPSRNQSPPHPYPLPQAYAAQQQNVAHGVPNPVYAPVLRAAQFAQPQQGGAGQLSSHGYHEQPEPIHQATSHLQLPRGAQMTNQIHPVHHPNGQPNVGYPPDQIRYIPTPAPAVPGFYPSPNEPPLVWTPRSHTPNPSTQSVRYHCELCGNTFSRSYDRKRHHESRHAETSSVHQCEICGKDFARADSLKRHVDGGCDRNRPRNHVVQPDV